MSDCGTGSTNTRMGDAAPAVPDGSPSSWGSAANSQRRRPGSPSILRRAANSATNLRRLTKHVQPGTSWPPSPVNDELDSSKHGAKERILYASSRSERDAWVRALRKASAQTPVADAYELQSKLGTGQFSDVFSAKKRSTGDMLAIKRVRTAGALYYKAIEMNEALYAMATPALKRCRTANIAKRKEREKRELLLKLEAESEAKPYTLVPEGPRVLGRPVSYTHLTLPTILLV